MNDTKSKEERREMEKKEELVKVNFHLQPLQYSYLRTMTTMCQYHSISKLINVAAVGFVSATIPIDQEVYDKIKFVDKVEHGETVMTTVTIPARTVELAKMEAKRLNDTLSNYLRNAVACMLDEIDVKRFYSLQRAIWSCLAKWEEPGALLDARRIQVGDIDPVINEYQRRSEIPRERSKRWRFQTARQDDLNPNEREKRRSLGSDKSQPARLKHISEANVERDDESGEATEKQD